MVWTDMAAVDPDGKLVYPSYLKVMYAAYQYFGEKDLFDSFYPLTEVAPSLAQQFPGARLMTGDIFSQMIMGNMVHTSTVMLSRERFERVDHFRVELRRSGEDFDFHLRTCREGPVGFVEVPSIDYQVGMPDQLTGRAYYVHMAQNFLNTIEPVIARDRDRIKLPESMIRQSLAYGHRWLGQELLASGEHKRARQHLAQSLRLKPTAMGMAACAATLLPPAALDGIRNLYRRYIKPLRYRGAGPSTSQPTAG